MKWDPNNPFTPLLKTADDAKSFIAAGGVACIESKIENVFGLRFDALKEKVRRLELKVTAMCLWQIFLWTQSSLIAEPCFWRMKNAQETQLFKTSIWPDEWMRQPQVSMSF
ncbi:hypothetical protein [Massilia phosphatilytica]